MSFVTTKQLQRTWRLPSSVVFGWARVTCKGDSFSSAKSCNVQSMRAFAPSLTRLCMYREMLATKGPYLLDVMVPHVEHVLPMIPGGASFKEVITDGDGTREY